MTTIRISFIFIVIVYLFIKPTIEQSSSALEQFVNDDSDKDLVGYELIDSSKQAGYTRYVLNATTLKWFDENLSDRSVWRHVMYVLVPDNYEGSIFSYLFIEAGKMNELNSGQLTNVASLAISFNCIGVIIKQIPNQPIIFKEDGISRSEDDAIAFTLNLFFKQRLSQSNNYKNIPLLAPMVKAVKRGMDVVQMFLKNSNIKAPEKFIVSGVSKRGWTAWLTAAISQKVLGAAPIVFDLINMNKCLHNQYKSFGGYSFAYGDYYKVAKMFDYLDTAEYDELSSIIDPYRYFDMLSSKKILLTLSSSDEFMLPSYLSQFWRELSIKTQDTSFVRRIPNLSHNPNPQMENIYKNIKNFISLNLDFKTPLPKITWKLGNNATHGVTEVQLSDLDAFDSYEIRAYRSRTVDANKIDYRAHSLNTFGNIASQTILWTSEIVSFNYHFDSSTANYPLKFQYSIDRKLWPNAYTSFYLVVNLKLKSYPYKSNIIPEDQLFIVSTESNTIPEYYPYMDCLGDECAGNLV